MLMMSVFFSLPMYAKNQEVNLLHNWMIENYQSIESNLEKRSFGNGSCTFFFGRNLEA